MQQIKIDEWSLPQKIIDIVDEKGVVDGDIVPYLNAQVAHLQTLANEKGKIIVFVPKGMYVIGESYLEQFDEYNISKDDFIRVEL